MAYLARNLTFYMNKLAGYSKQTIKLRPIGNDTATEDSVVTFRLPSALIDLHSLQFYSNVKMQATNGTSVTTDVPKITIGDLNDYIRRLDVSANGVSLNSNLMEYNTAHRILDMVHGSERKNVERSLYSRSYQVVANPNTNDDALAFENAIFNDHNKLPTTAGEVTSSGAMYNTEGFLGFLSGSHQRFLPTNLFGDLEIRITLDNKRMCFANGVARKEGSSDRGAMGTSLKSVDFSDIHLVFETIHFEDDMMNEMLERRLASGESIDIPFVNLTSFTNSLSTNNSTTVFSLATDSLDHMICTQRHTSGDYSMDEKYTNTQTVSLYDPSAMGNVRWRFTANNSDYQWVINDTAIPSFRADPDHIYNLNKQAVSAMGDVTYNPDIRSHYQFRDGRFCWVTSFNHHTDPSDHLQSGLDTKGSNATMQLQTFASDAASRNGGPYGANAMHAFAPSQLYILALMTSVVKVYAGKVIELVV